MVEYFDERCTEFRRNIFVDVPFLEFENNMNYVLHIRNILTETNKIKDLRLSDIYCALGIPFPENYLLDYKLKKNQHAFEFSFDEESGKIKIEIDVPDQPVLKDTGDALEYTFTFKKED